MKKKLTIKGYYKEMSLKKLTAIYAFLDDYLTQFKERHGCVKPKTYSCDEVMVTIGQTKDFVIIKVIN